jgi:hypothetical protein
MGGVELRHPEVELDRTDVVQARDIVALLHVGAGADQAQADGAGERRGNDGLGQAHLRLAAQGLGAVQVVLGDIERFLADEFLGEQLLGALVALGIGAHLRIGLGELRPVLRRIQRHQLGALRHVLAFGEVNVHHATIQLGPDDDRFLGQQAAHRAHVGLHLAHRHLHGPDRQAHRWPAGGGARPRGLGWASGGRLLLLAASRGRSGDDQRRE